MTLVTVAVVSSLFIAHDYSEPSTGGNSVKGCSWVIWQDAGTYQAIDKTGRNVYHVNNFSTTFHDVLSAINGGGGEICISDGTYLVEGSLGSGLPASVWNNLALTGNGVGTVFQLAPGLARLADPTKYSSGATEMTLGLNWYLNRWVRAQLNWEHVWFDDPVLQAVRIGQERPHGQHAQRIHVAGRT